MFQDLLTAIQMQNMLTYGLNRSPIRADFQGIPKILRGRGDKISVDKFHVELAKKRLARVAYPSLCRSIIPGAMECA